MDAELTLDVGQANELKLAFRRCGWTNQDIKRLSEGEMLKGLLPVVRGQAEVRPVDHLIDLDADPFIPQDWQMEEHKKGGVFKWDAAKVKLYLSSNQQGSKYIRGHELRQELAGRLVFNANLLDYLLAHPGLIPEAWKGKAVFFWGTIYRGSDGSLCVRCLCWSGGRWFWHSCWLGGYWRAGCPAAVPASEA